MIVYVPVFVSSAASVFCGSAFFAMRTRLSDQHLLRGVISKYRELCFGAYAIRTDTYTFTARRARRPQARMAQIREEEESQSRKERSRLR